MCLLFVTDAEGHESREDVAGYIHPASCGDTGRSQEVRREGKKISMEATDWTALCYGT